MGQRQKTIDFERINMRRWLESLELPDVPGVAGATARDVLLAIYDVDAGRPCWPGQERIAAMSRVGDRQIRRVLGVLRDRFGLLATFRGQPPEAASRKTLTHYVIVWSEVAVLLNRQSCPVDPVSCPVDPVSCPVDPVSCPVDRRADNIYARTLRNGTETEKETTTTVLSNATVGFETRPSTMAAPLTGTDGWAEVAEVLKSEGIFIRGRLVHQWRGAGRESSEVLSEVRECIRVVSLPANRCRCSNPKAVLVTRLQTGTWPVDVFQDVERAERRDQADMSRKQESCWKSAVHSAWLDVRRETPRGELVEEAAVVRRAVEVYHVPTDFAARERGLADVDFADACAASPT